MPNFYSAFCDAPCKAFVTCFIILSVDYRVFSQLNPFLSLLLYRQKEQKLCTWCNYSLSQSLR